MVSARIQFVHLSRSYTKPIRNLYETHALLPACNNLRYNVAVLKAENNSRLETNPPFKAKFYWVRVLLRCADSIKSSCLQIFNEFCYPKLVGWMALNFVPSLNFSNHNSGNAIGIAAESPQLRGRCGGARTCSG
jgi:hypothetical protein